MHRSHRILLGFAILALHLVVANAHGTSVWRCLYGSTKILDATHLLSEDTPSDESGGARFRRVTTATYEVNYYKKENYNMSSGAGTTFDSPSHQFANTRTVTDFYPAELLSPLVVLDVRHKVVNNSDYAVVVQDIHNWEWENGRIPDGAVVVMKSGWSSKYGNETAYRNTDNNNSNLFHFPGFGDAAAQFLVNQRNIRGLGVDTLSLDYGATQTYGVHGAVLGANKYGLENLNLSSPLIPASGGCILVAPVKIKDAPEAPTRVLIFV